MPPLGFYSSTRRKTKALTLPKGLEPSGMRRSHPTATPLGLLGERGAHDVEHFWQGLLKRRDDVGVKMSARFAADQRHRVGGGHGHAIWAESGDGIKYIGDRKDARAERNGGAAQAARVPRAIELFVMREHNV